jgi:uncharacterized protein (TIGR03118 family)
MRSIVRGLVPLVLSAAVCVAGIARADGDDFVYKQTNLVSDGAVEAQTTDMQLKNPWGITAFAGAPFWVSDNATGLSTLYDGQGHIIPLTVKIPPPGGSAPGTLAAPTGIVWNPNGMLFQLAAGQAALFIFATEDGTISAWNPNVDLHNAVLKVDNSEGGNGAVYKGLALATNPSGVFLYATNFRAGTIDVFDSTFKPATLPGSFADPAVPAGYAPFGIALIDGNLYVSYAVQDAARHDDVKGPGHGIVDVFDTSGRLIQRFASHGALNSPWGMVRAPRDFGGFSSRVLIGNFGDGHISAFDSAGQFRGQLLDTTGRRIFIDGLWGLAFGNALASDPRKLYFTAGLNGEMDGLFGSLEAVEPVERLEH